VTRRTPTGAWLAALLLIGATAGADEADRPEILHVAIAARLGADRPGEARVTYRAPRANVVAVIEVVEDLDGARRTTRQRELGVIAAAFGREAGELVVPLAFATPGRKRVVLTLVTDEREESEPAIAEIEVVP
jgi:predicted outer membrane protein